MNKNSLSGPKALVTVFDELESAQKVVKKLHESGFPLERIELVSNHIVDEAPEVETPKVHETTTSSLVDNATKWGGVGIASGLIAGLLTPFPGIALGMAIIGGVTGAIVGGTAGIEHAVEDDSVDLPTLEEYENLVMNGDKLLVVLGEHEEVIRAESIIKEMHGVGSHIHPVHGHDYHVHPSHHIQK